MSGRPSALPDFERPPVIEVVLGVQFARIGGFQTVHAGYLWDAFRRDFPNVDEQPPLNPSFETFGTRPSGDSVGLELISGPLPFPRLWFLNEGRTELIQFQPDRFIHNWRKVQVEDVYPRYEQIKGRFGDEINKVQAFLNEQNLGDLRPNQCEISYINHIVTADGQNPCSEPESIFRFVAGEFATDTLGTFEDAGFLLRFVLHSEDNRAIGRLLVSAQPAVSGEGKPMIVLALTARGSPSAPTLAAVSQFMDRGREKIVRGFTELTTRKMHELWGRKE